MKELFAMLQDMTPSRWAMTIGTVGMLASGVATGVFGLEVHQDMKFAVFGTCALIFIAGFCGSLYMKKLDTELRETKIEHGQDPEDDKTIIR